MYKGKRGAASYIHAECSNPGLDSGGDSGGGVGGSSGSGSTQHLNELLDILLNPSKPIDDWETIDWCKWLMAGGRTPDEFASTGALHRERIRSIMLL